MACETAGINLQGPILCIRTHGWQFLSKKVDRLLTKNPLSETNVEFGFFVSSFLGQLFCFRISPCWSQHRIGPCKFIPIGDSRHNALNRKHSSKLWKSQYTSRTYQHKYNDYFYAYRYLRITFTDRNLFILPLRLHFSSLPFLNQCDAVTYEECDNKSKAEYHGCYIISRISTFDIYLPFAQYYSRYDQ